MEKRFLTLGLCFGIAILTACGHSNRNGNSNSDSTSSMNGAGSDSSNMKGGANPQSDSSRTDSTTMKPDSTKSPGIR